MGEGRGGNITNVERYGVEYEGYVWVNLSHFSLFELAGQVNKKSMDDDEEDKKASWIEIPILITIILLLMILLFSVDLWYGEIGRGKDRTEKYMETKMKIKWKGMIKKEKLKNPKHDDMEIKQ